MKKVSIRDVAKEAGVSITTVSHALNGYPDVSPITRDKILAIAQKLNYAPNANARSLGGKTDTTIALIVSDLQPVDESGLVFGILSGLYHACAKLGYELILVATNTIQQEKISYVQLCHSKNINAVVVIGLRTDDPYYHEILSSEIPCILVDAFVKGKNVACVSTDNMKAAQEAVEYLVDKGHKHVGMINGKSAAAVSNERFSGYATALLSKGLVLELDYVVCADFEEEIAFEKTRALLQARPEITALFCASDLMAIGAIRAVKSLGRKVPSHVSVIGFDDIPTAKYVSGGISTVRQDPFQMGLCAGTTVQQMLGGEDMPEKILVPYQFIVRATA